MNLDSVHDIQSVYRKVLNSMARPGTVMSLKDESSKVEKFVKCYHSTFLIMMMLLDGEVSFNIVSKNYIDVSGTISQMTYAKVKSVEEADYIFVLDDLCDEKLSEVIENSKIGDLIDPNKSATIIVEKDLIESAGDLVFKGPGIKNESTVNISGDRKWINYRNNKNLEYPLGVDMIFIDKNDNVISIPRTTLIKED